MPKTLVWISGASGGVGRALANTAPFDDARLLGISRGKPPVGAAEVDLDNGAVVDLRSLDEDESG